MDIKKWVPWNWFKKEEDTNTSVQVRHRKTQSRSDLGSSPLGFFHQEIDRMFDHLLSQWSGLGDYPGTPSGIDKSFFKPTLDLSATDKAYTVSVEIPGVDEKDVKLELSDDTLTIRGEKRQEKEEKEKNYYRMERAYGAFRRVLSLPADADQQAITAKFKKGILTITMPRKALPESNVKRIEVKSA
jgi:HSP20 family protein